MTTTHWRTINWAWAAIATPATAATIASMVKLLTHFPPSCSFSGFTLRTTFYTRAIMRPLLFLLGWLLFGVGFIGVFVPVLPTTPLMLLALWCFSRSSDRFHNWLYTHKLFGPPLQQWHKYRVIPLTAKFIAILFMIGSLVYMFVFLTMPVWAKVLMSISMAFASWYILTKPSFPPKK